MTAGLISLVTHYQGSFPMGTTGNGVPIPFAALGTAFLHLFERF